MTEPTRGARAPAQRPQARLGAADGVAGARHRGQFCPGVHRPGGVAEARRHPGAVGRGGGGVRVGHLPQTKRHRPGQGAGPQARLRLAAGSGDLGAPGVRAVGGDPAAPRAGYRNCVPRPPTRSPACAPNWPRLRANLEILFDADLSHRPAIETDREPRLQRLAARHGNHGPGDRQPDRHRRPRGPRLEHRGEPDHRRAVRTASGRVRVGAAAEFGGAHRRPSEAEQEAQRHRVEEPPARVVTTATAAVASTGPAARTRAPIRLAATATGAPARPASRTALACAAA